MPETLEKIGSRFAMVLEGRRLEMDPELDRFCRTKIERMLDFYAVASLPVAFLFQLFGLTLEWKVSIFSGLGDQLLMVHGVCFALLVVAFLLFRIGRTLSGRRVVLGYYFLTAYLVTRVCEVCLSIPVYDSLQIYFYGLHNIVLSLIIIALPFHRRWIQVVFALFCTFLTWWMVDGKAQFSSHIVMGAILMGVIYGGALLVRGIVDGFFLHFFIGEYDALQRVVKAERALIDRDLNLARRIQDSLVPPATTIWNAARIDYYSKKNRVVGGDWAALHSDRTGKLTIIVADAMGKGIHAAMLIHTVQSLWADVMGRNTGIDPATWLDRVNHALLNLDRQNGNFVTIGILQLAENDGVYWSAGHLPLFLADLDDSRAGQSLLSRGGPCGMSPNFSVEPTYFSLGQHNMILLGTDGIFGKGSRHTRRQIYDIAHRSADSAASAVPLDLDDLSKVEDDKTLITVFYREKIYKAAA